METFSLLLLGLGFILAEASESIMGIIKEEFAEEKMQPETIKSGQEKETDGVLMNLTLFNKNDSLSLPKDAMPSLLLTFRSCCSIPKGNSPVSDKECFGNKMTWSKFSEANETYELNNFIHSPAEVIHRVHKAYSCKRGKNCGIWVCQSPELENTVCQLSPGKQFPRCQYHSITSLKKILMVLAGHSLMSWLVSGSKL
ncbi:probable ribonuclease 11 [Cavia porcellus]|uniref:Ribonuclease A J1 n=1 Tax=Cavia porcellus TaxID=10141 RepID=W0UUZ4_CAVPO|nr:probable ribonuclease 11 [Cavia porcellus]CDG32057.1 TPA: ribonuclease A J1 [Cavia porcellus]